LAEYKKFLFLYQILQNMKWIKLTAYASILFGGLLSLGSCEKEAEAKKGTHYTKTGIILSGAQETPATPSSALGTMDVTYIKGTKTLTYKVTWSGLTAAPQAMHIHGLAPTGFAAPVLQTIISAPNVNFPASGTYSGTLLVDGVVVKEENLLNGLYYVNIHTPMYPAGEIRGQIRFQ
jgi:hypothetical protein